MTKKEEKWYLYKMCFLYGASCFFGFLALALSWLLFLWGIQLFVTIGPWMWIVLVVVGFVLVGLNVRRVLAIPVIKNWLNYDLNRLD